MTTNRKFRESPIPQGADEEIAYILTTTPWGSSPTSPVVSIMVKGGIHDSKLLSTSVCTVSDDTITTGRVKGLQSKATYELQIRFTINSNVFEAIGEIIVP